MGNNQFADGSKRTCVREGIKQRWAGHGSVCVVRSVSRDATKPRSTNEAIPSVAKQATQAFFALPGVSGSTHWDAATP